MAKGTWIKSQERRCHGKARFDSAYEAEQFNPRQRAYECPICHHWHLTSLPGKSKAAPPLPEPPPPAPRNPKLGDIVDLDALARTPPKPRPTRTKPGPPKRVPPVVPEPAPTPPPRRAVVVRRAGKDHRVLLNLDGRAVKSARILGNMRELSVGDEVDVSWDQPPEILGRRPRNEP